MLAPAELTRASTGMARERIRRPVVGGRARPGPHPRRQPVRDIRSGQRLPACQRNAALRHWQSHVTNMCRSPGIDQRPRLAFATAEPVDDASLIGISLTGGTGSRGAGPRMRAADKELAIRLTETVRRLDLDNRELLIDRGQDAEEVLPLSWFACAYSDICRPEVACAVVAAAGLGQSSAGQGVMRPGTGAGGAPHRRRGTEPGVRGVSSFFNLSSVVGR
ncbi:hypothetical protein GCM10009654_23130 [Streptomyces hebeiensis]|uniref:Uncharacterized protein n=1 Tax=Streptomyces hebeiensis TaxID=229486 RepID=A0ABN1US59_9ACTN